MDIERLLRDFGIPFVVGGEHQHASQGWVNVHCPFCVGPQNYHLGISSEHSGCHCWRCGGHSMTETISKLLAVPISEAQRIMARYGVVISSRKAEPRVSIHPLKYPQPYGPLTNRGKRYLAKRRFDPDYLEFEWGLLETGPVSFLDSISYGNRLLIPIHWNGELVSFQTRDITEKSDRKYLACPMKREAISHKTILYGKQEYWPSSEIVIIVEGVTDAWRLGPRAVAVFGIEFKMEQVLQLARTHFKRYYIIFDNEPQAQEQARKLAVKLKALGKRAIIRTVEDDPGNMKQDDADHLVQELLGGKP